MPVKCQLCQADVPNFECLSRHYINVHQNRNMSNEAGKCRFCIRNNPRNLNKLARYRNEEELDAHVKKEHQETPTPVAAAVPPLARCVLCRKEFELYSSLREHYITEHNDRYRAEGAGVCHMCDIMNRFEMVQQSGEPCQTLPFMSYQDLKDHWIRAHWIGMSQAAKDALDRNTLGLCTGSM